jgi:hypothetical protein
MLSKIFPPGGSVTHELPQRDDVLSKLELECILCKMIIDNVPLIDHYSSMLSPGFDLDVI